MSAPVISFLVAAGIATWIYAKFQRSSGNNTKQSAIAAAVAGILIFIFLIIILATFIKND